MDSLRAKYGEVWSETHGGGGGAVHTFQLNPGAKIFLVQGRAGSRLDELEFVTDDGTVYGPVGGGGGAPWVSSHPGCYLSYFSGSSGSRLDSLSLHWECPGE